MKNYFAKSFILRVLLVFSPVPLLYLLLSRFGYVIPITDLPGMLCINGCTSQSFAHTPIRGYEMLNVDKPLKELINEIIDKRQNWTLGCPSLKNKDVDELYEVVQRGTVVEILP